MRLFQLKISPVVNDWALLLISYLRKYLISGSYRDQQDAETLSHVPRRPCPSNRYSHHSVSITLMVLICMYLSVNRISLNYQQFNVLLRYCYHRRETCRYTDTLLTFLDTLYWMLAVGTANGEALISHLPLASGYPVHILCFSFFSVFLRSTTDDRGIQPHNEPWHLLH